MNKTFIISLLIFSILFTGCEKEDFISSQPDSKIIFLSGSHENSVGWKLMIMNKDGSNQYEITDLSAAYEKPVVSHSGKTVLFVHYADDSFYELYSINLDGTELTFIDRAEKYIGAADWSANDSKIVYSKYIDEDTTDYSPPLYIDPTNDIIIYDVLSREKNVLTDTLNNNSPRFSHDDKIIAFAETKGSSRGVYYMDIDGSDKQLILPGGYEPVWSPDGRKIAYTAIVENQSPQVFVADSDGSNPIQLTYSHVTNYSGTGPPAFGNYYPQWTPDGRKIVYQSDVDKGEPEIYTVNISGSEITRLTDSYRDNENPEISSDGMYILFATTRNLAYEGEIYLMDIYGENETPLSKIAGDEAFPVYTDK